MMKNQIDISEAGASGAQKNAADDDSWNALAERIQKLVMRRSRSMLTENDDDIFDRGARTLRLLMSSAQISERMKKDEAKERETDDRRASGQGLTEEDIEATYRKIFNTVERIEREDAGGGSGNAAQGDGADAPSGSRSGGEALAGERS